MSTATSQNDSQVDYYAYLRDTSDLARSLVERLIFLEESALSANADLIRVQIQGMVDQQISQQVGSIQAPNPGF